MLDMYRFRYVSVQYSIHIEHACFRNHFLQLSAMVAFPQLHPWCTAAAASFFTRKEPATLAASSNSQAWPCGLTCTTCWTGSDALVSLSCLGWSFGQRENWTWLWQRFTTPHSHNQLIYINLYFPKIWSIVSYHPCHPYEYHPIKGTFWGHLPRCHPAWCLAPLFSQTSGGHHGKRAQVKSTSKMRWFTAAKITKTSTNPKKVFGDQRNNWITLSRSCNGLCPKKDIPKSQRSSSKVPRRLRWCWWHQATWEGPASPRMRCFAGEWASKSWFSIGVELDQFPRHRHSGPRP